MQKLVVSSQVQQVKSSKCERALVVAVTIPVVFVTILELAREPGYVWSYAVFCQRAENDPKQKFSERRTARKGTTARLTTFGLSCPPVC